MTLSVLYVAWEDAARLADNAAEQVRLLGQDVPEDLHRELARLNADAQIKLQLLQAEVAAPRASPE